MHGIIPKPVVNGGFISQGGLQALATAAAQFGISGGPFDVVGVQGVVPSPENRIDWAWAIIDDADGNQHAWSEAVIDNPDIPARMENGRRGFLAGMGSGSGAGASQVAWGLNGESYPAGTVVFIVRINWNGWGIVGANSDAVGSGSSTPFNVNCGDGTSTSYVITHSNGTWTATAQ